MVGDQSISLCILINDTERQNVLRIFQTNKLSSGQTLCVRKTDSMKFVNLHERHVLSFVPGKGRMCIVTAPRKQEMSKIDRDYMPKQ